MAIVAAGLRVCALLFTAVLLGSCTNTVVPPSVPEQPVAAFLLDHGRHASIVLEDADGFTRYSYGHWDHYAMNRTGPLGASGPLIGRNRAAFGRRQFPGPADLDTVHRRVLVPIEAAWRIEVPADNAATLIARFEGYFRDESRKPVFNPLYDLEFVPHPALYSAGHNSNHVTGEWLRALGCRVDMGGPFSVWEVQAPLEP